MKYKLAQHQQYQQQPGTHTAGGLSATTGQGMCNRGAPAALTPTVSSLFLALTSATIWAATALRAAAVSAWSALGVHWGMSTSSQSVQPT